MKITFYGTRGSVPVANKASVATGGNTTCLRIDSQCLPEGMWLFNDAGSGIVPASLDAVKNGVKSVMIAFSHYHWDHTQGLPLAGHLTFNKSIPITCYGPIDEGLGPREVLQATMKRPFFPVDFSEVASHFRCHKIEHPNTQVILIHPKGGVKKMSVDQYEAFDGKLLPFKEGRKYPKDECLVIRMMRSSHPEMTISYRFEEGPTGKVFVLLTDHENQYATPLAMKAFLKDADFLAMDSQYTEKKYKEQAAGYGHGTPAYCVRVAIESGVKKLGLTHHDPFSTDDQIKGILAEAQKALQGHLAAAKESRPNSASPALKAKSIFACQDYQVVTV